jgi:hypothetical protein
VRCPAKKKRRKRMATGLQFALSDVSDHYAFSHIEFVTKDGKTHREDAVVVTGSHEAVPVLMSHCSSAFLTGLIAGRGCDGDKGASRSALRR